MVKRPVKEGEDERAGRWKGQAKTECGIHNKRSRYADYLRKIELQRQEQVFSEALKKVELDQGPADGTSAVSVLQRGASLPLVGCFLL